MKKERDVELEENWKKFWEEIIFPNGELDLEQLKKELFDYTFLMDQVPKVYMHITGDRMSKTDYYAETVIRESDDYQQSLFEEWLKDELEERGIK